MISRREFLDYSARLALMLGLGTSAVPRISEALELLSSEAPPVLWLQGQSCSGCSVSFMNTDAPGPAAMLLRYLSLKFHSTLSTATGDVGMDIVHSTIERGGFYLVVEGAMPVGMPEACKMGHEPMTDLVARAAARAKAVVSVGTCAAYGGIPSAQNNPTGAMGVPEHLKRLNISTTMVRIPGCPAHPDWTVGTLVHIIKFGMPELDNELRPKLFYSKLIHERCHRFADYERENFAKQFSDDGCLFKLGCVGTNTYADCTLRFWNSRTNSCIPSGGPCIGCASEQFASKASFPFYRKTESANKKEDNRS
ncbi:MAG: hydrogenase small subunit [Pseudomonadota bacterium]